MPLIAIYPNEILLTSCDPVEDIRDAQECILDLTVALNALGVGCLGLASNQIGCSLQILVLRVGGKPQIMVNPRITECGEITKVEREYCFSLPEISRLVEAWDEVDIEYTNQSGEFVNQHLSGIEARAFQHELHHLEGRTILEYGPSGLSASKVKHMTRKYKGWRYV